MREIDLYINNHRVDLDADDIVVLNYQSTDYSNPTAVKNTYSNTIAIKGTPNNNQIFNSIFDLKRTQNLTDSYFNPSKRVDFELFVDGALTESGYCKLDSIKGEMTDITYNVTLYGGLGDFFYSLAHDENGDERTLDKLAYLTGSDDELDIRVTANAVYEAWSNLDSGNGGKYSVINFAPTYDGLPDDFDTDKILIDVENYKGYVRVGTSASPQNEVFPQSYGDYGTYNGYVLGEAQEEMTEWETRDLRCYLQRPVLSVPAFINAICDPSNNGGYTVKLDQRFFTNSNPYYNDAWITLPSLLDLDLDRSDAYSLTATVTGGTNPYQITFSGGLDDTSNVTVNYQPALRVSGGPSILYTNTMIGPSAKKDVRNCFAYNSAFFIQLIAYDSADNIVGGSTCYMLTSNQPDDWQYVYDTTAEYLSYTPRFNVDTDIQKVSGYFKQSGSSTLYNWINTSGDICTLNLKLNTSIVSASKYAIVIDQVARRRRVISSIDYTESNETYPWLYSTLTNTAVSPLNETINQYSYYAKNSGSITSATYTTKDGDTGTGMLVTKKNLLGAMDGSALDWLLSYTKLFDLRFVKDVYSKTIKILTRRSYYQEDNTDDEYMVVDLTDRIDYSDLTISPLTFSNKWYYMGFPEEETTAYLTKYSNSYANRFGIQKIDTGYDFDSEINDVYEDNKFINAIEGSEKSRYFLHRMQSGFDVPTFFYNWVSISYFNSAGDASDEVYIGMPSDYSTCYYTSGNAEYDLVSKLQLHNDNDPNDGVGILCFFNGFSSLTDSNGHDVPYYLSDDTNEMMVLNNDKPCWIYAPEVTTRLYSIPHFGRYITISNNISVSWDFGNTKELYDPTLKYANDSTGIYSKYWQSYMDDLLDIDSKIVECNVRLPHITDDSLRRFYYFDGGYWVLNKVTNYNPASSEGTLCEFTKVQSINNYRTELDYKATIRLSMDNLGVTKDGGTLTGYVYTSEEYTTWAWYNSAIVTYSNGNKEVFLTTDMVTPSSGGTGTTKVTITIPENTNAYSRTIRILVVDASGTYSSPVYLSQAGTATSGALDVSPTTINLDWYNRQMLTHNTLKITTTGDWTITTSGD